MSEELAAVIVLAAGRGTRMRSARPKVLFPLAGRSLLGHVLSAVEPLHPGRVCVVVGHAADAVTEHLQRLHAHVETVRQEEQRGTGHAARIALEALHGMADDAAVLVLPGDTPLLRTRTLRDLVAARGDGPAGLLTARIADPTGYGRIVRSAGGAVEAIVEERDASPSQRAIDEVNAGVYVFAAGPLREALGRLDSDNAQGEEYLTDVIAQLRALGSPVAAVAAPAEETAGINDRVQLAAAGRLLNQRLLEAHMLAGVTVIDPATTWLDVEVTLEPDVVLHPGTTLRGTTAIQRDAEIGPHATLTDTVVRDGARVVASTCSGADIGPGATVGPYSYLRPGTRLGRRSKVGAYVETKEAHIGDDTKVPHLSYVGDASIGARSNIGAGTIVVNYDGVAKHRTTIGSDVRIGSNNSLVAPVVVHDSAYTAAGSAITLDVPEGALGVGRARQRNVVEWVARRRRGGGGGAATNG